MESFPGKLSPPFEWLITAISIVFDSSPPTSLSIWSWTSLCSVLNIHWKDWCWSWNSNTLATWYKQLTHLKRPWCWERLRAGGKGHNRGWDGWLAAPTRWTRVWVDSRSWWWTGRPGVLQSMGSQRVGHDWATELNDTLFQIEVVSFQRAVVHSDSLGSSSEALLWSWSMSVGWSMSECCSLRTTPLPPECSTASRRQPYGWAQMRAVSIWYSWPQNLG